MPSVNIGDQLQLLNAMPVASISTTTLGAEIDMSDYEGEIVVLIDVKNVSGTTPTCDIAVQESATTGGSYANATGGTFTQVTTVASAQKISLNSNELKGFLKINAVLGGTTPVYLVSAKILGTKKYPA